MLRKIHEHDFYHYLIEKEDEVVECDQDKINYRKMIELKNIKKHYML
jgi:hypothetical protein